LGNDLSHAVSLECEAVGVVDEAIEDGVGDVGVGDDLVPVLDRHLAGDDGRAALVVVDDLEEMFDSGKASVATPITLTRTALGSIRRSREPEEDARVASPEHSKHDAAILNEIRELTRRIRDRRTQVILGSLIDAVALNPQPLPPRVHELFRAVLDALNPQPLPPGLPPETA
jgi:hypothetical protein